ncbi:MAG: acetyl-CoA decarbonylase/synthase complex subunit delta [Deltaproteobacteria bacterium]|nr:acetyl-CoA decarbonylase/synthase complex subunit delta [Deltaproteobacteria bacterium]
MTASVPPPAFPGRIVTVTLPAGPGGIPVTVGGQNGLPLFLEGEHPGRHAVGMEIATCAGELPPALAAYGTILSDPVACAKKAAGEWGAQFLFLSLAICHPDAGERPVEEAAALVREILCSVPLPAIVGGCGDESVDARLFPAVAEAAPRPVFLSYADEKNCRLVGGAALAYGHGVVSWSPIDVNMAKQVNLLLSDIGVPPERILIDPLTGGLGYGLEYTYSTVERIRLAGLAGDGMLARPVLCLLGDAWKARETADSSEAAWGDPAVRGRRWEETTGWACLAAGADLLVCRHPANVLAFREVAWR